MNDNTTFQRFCEIANVSDLKKIEVALYFMWFNYFTTGENNINISTINNYFSEAHLAMFPISRLKDEFRKSSKVSKSSENNSYKLSRKIIDELSSKFGHRLKAIDVEVIERADLSKTPYLNIEDVVQAKRMSELYVIIYCFENSVRKYIEFSLKKLYGENWWDTVKSKDLENKYTSRKEKEARAKWIGNRGSGSPLFYLDWSDLVKIIRKEEAVFSTTVNDIKFLELRMEELERTRNIIAHNGMVPSDDDFDRLVLYFKDWCKQVTPIVN